MVKLSLMNGKWQNLHFDREIFLHTERISMRLLSFTQAGNSDLIVMEEIRIFSLLILSKIVEIITGNMLSIEVI